MSMEAGGKRELKTTDQLSAQGASAPGPATGPPILPEPSASPLAGIATGLCVALIVGGGIIWALRSLLADDTAEQLGDGQSELQATIERFYMNNGFYPFALESLVPDYLAAVPVGEHGSSVYTYDSETGEVRAIALLEPAVLETFASRDGRNLANLIGALDDYHDVYGEYPESLEGLEPEFIAAVPVVGPTGENYWYTAALGEVSLPPDLETIYSVTPTGGEQARAVELVAQRSEIEDALDRCHDDLGFYPQYLSSLVPDYIDGIPRAPDGSTAFIYDPGAGEVQALALLPPDALYSLANGDLDNVAFLQGAIDDYHAERGYYPSSLEELQRGYIGELPVANITGEAYAYSQAAGEVTLPEELRDIYDSLDPVSEEDLEPGNVQQTFYERLSQLVALDELGEGAGYPDPKRILSEGASVLTSHRQALDAENSFGVDEAEEIDPTSAAAAVLERFRSGNEAGYPTPEEVLRAGTGLFSELYNEDDEPVERGEFNDLYDEASRKYNDPDTPESELPSIEDVLEAGKRLFQMYEGAVANPE